MDRGSSKHGPRLDEQMDHEVRGIVQGGVNTRAEEPNDPEPAGEDQPDATWEGAGSHTGGAPPGMTYEEVEQRSRLGRYIPRASLPGNRKALLAGARALNAPEDVLQRIAKLPPDTEFVTVSEIWAALGYHNEDVRHRT
jgi:hypothetical protein